LNDAEIDILVEEIKKFPNPITGKKSWKTFDPVYIAKTVQNDFVGVCGIKKLNGWIKFGPFVVFKKYHGQGYGRKILSMAVKDYPDDNLFIGSRNPAVAKLATSFGFHEIKKILKMPRTIQFYLAGYIFQNLSLEFFKECIRKNPTQEGPYRVFLRYKKN
jgi:GNAT superfamily N-acetyltransferase